MFQRLKRPREAGRYLTRALNQEEPAELQGRLLDVVHAHGGFGRAAKKAALSEWRMRLVLWDEEEARKILRLCAILRGFGLRLAAVAIKEVVK